MTNFVKYETSIDALELVINETSGEVFASQRALARMCGVEDTTISRFKGAAQWTLLSAQVHTAGGFQTVTLLTISQLAQCLARYNPALLEHLVALELISASELASLVPTQFRTKESIRKKSLYILQCPETKVIKIGIAISPEQRLSAIQVGYPYRLDLIRVIKPLKGTAERLEKILHKALDDFRLNGEWFDGVALQMIGEV